MTTTPPQPPQGPYAGQPSGYGPPQQQQPFPQYSQPGQQVPPQGQPYQDQPYQGQPQYGTQDGQQYQAQPGAYQQPYAGQQAPQYGQYQQQGQYQEQYQGQQGQSFPQPGYAPQGQLSCRFCGGYPAVDATVRGHQGMIILMRFLKLRGPFCRTCGIASVRDMTSKSLWQGWWGIGSSIINPITMLMNIGPMQKFKRMPEPTPGPGRPMDPGKPLFQRPAILMLLLPIAFIALLIVGNLNSTESKAEFGSCVVNKGTSASPDVKVVKCSSSEAEYRVIGRFDSTDESKCGDQTDATYVDERNNYTLCLAKIK
ncbi:MAG: toxin-antitoxin system, toxin component [Kribbellaceae bacterium]|nr:toxin-antitoxin system, toxin component [Kribbellaceae bacterium]